MIIISIMVVIIAILRGEIIIALVSYTSQLTMKYNNTILVYSFDCRTAAFFRAIIMTSNVQNTSLNTVQLVITIARRILRHSS